MGLIIFSGNTVNVSGARLANMLKYGYMATTHKLQDSHLCGNPKCTRHLCIESGAANMSRIKCHSSGSAADCEHSPACVFQREGVFLPCRSDADLTKCICGLDCFAGGSTFYSIFD